MRKIIAALLTVVVMMMGSLAFAGAAGATDGDIPSPDNNKKVTLCHATGSETNPYEKITVSVNAFYSAGHIDHAGDIFQGFTWTDKKGVEHVVSSQGDTSLLAFEDCEKPAEDEEIVKPEPVYVDKCETKDDVFSVAPGNGYTVGNVVVSADSQSITVTANDGFVFVGGDKSVTFTKPLFTDVACDLPETGGVETAVDAGIGSLVAILLASAAFVLIGRRKTTV